MQIHTRAGIAAILIFGLAGLGIVSSVLAAGESLRIEPSNSAAARGTTLTVRVVQSSSVATSGAQSTITFDPSLLQIASVTRGARYAGAQVFLAADEGSIAAANTRGALTTVAAVFFPPVFVPAGESDFLVVAFTAVGCGSTDLGLPVGPADAGLIDGRLPTYGDELPVVATGGRVTIDCGPAGAAGAGSTLPLTGLGSAAPAAPDPSALNLNAAPPWFALGLISLLTLALAAGGLWFRRTRA